MSKHKPLKQTYLYCDKCKTVNTIQRTTNRLKSSGHHKHLYCVSCKIRTRHIELGDEFKYEQFKRQNSKESQLLTS